MKIVFFADISWDGLFQRPQHLTRALSREWEVLFVEPATMLEKLYFRPRLVEKNIAAISVPSIPYNARNATVKKISQGLASSGLVQDIVVAGQFAVLKNALGGNRSDLGVVVQSVMQYNLARRLKPKFIIYDYIDNIFGFSDVPEPVKRQWEECAASASMVTVTSPVLERQLRPFRKGPIQYIGNGAEYSFFSDVSRLQRPADLPTGKPIVGYIGAVYPWLNYDMIEAAAKGMPDLNFVLLGRTHPEIEPVLSRLKLLPNIHVLGFRPYAEVPAYMNFMDVCTIPFQYNELTAAVNPVKVYEYSAAGKPTVSTDFSEDIRQYGMIITIVNTTDEFVAGIRTALAGAGDPATTESLRAFARQNDWSSKTGQFVELVRQCSDSSL